MHSLLAHSRPTAIRAVVIRTMLAALALYAGACAEPPQEVEEAVASTTAPLWVNGDFESSAIGASPAGWTITNHRNFGITNLRPGAQTFASLNLQTGGVLNTVVMGGAAESQVEPALGAGASLRLPRYGVRAGVVNYNPSVAVGNNYNANVMRQTMTAALGDVDAVDGNVHVRFVVAPVLENPGHAYEQQPYYYVELRNITRSTTLYQDFNTSAQAGVPWKISNNVYYTDWQLVDIAPGNAALAVGDQVELIVVAAGCSQRGHWGRVYVDGVASTIPGIYTWASGAQLVTANSNLTYTVNYRNGGSGSAAGTTLAFNTPPDTTFQSVSLGSPTCTSPAVNSAGLVTCSLGTLAPGATSSFTVTVRVNAGVAAGTVITAGNYAIAATGVSPLLGQKVNTTVVASATFANVGVTKTDNSAAREWGTATSYTIVVSNAGPSTASSVTVADTMPAQLTGATWTCAGAGGATCGASGSGNINDTASIPMGGTATYTISANIIAGSGAGSVSNTVTATVGGGATDSDTGNNAAADTTALGSLRTLTVTKTGALGGTITSAPAAISCGTSCSSANASFLDGATVILTASPVPNASFTGWGGACAAFGTASTCTLTISANTSVTANFVPPPFITATGGTPQSTSVGTAFGSPLSATVADANGNPIAGATVTFTVVPVGGAGATVTPLSATTNASGVASVNATANLVLGNYTVTATTTGAPTPATFSLGNVVGPPALFDIVSGSPQSTTVNTAFGAVLSVRIRDALTNPIAGQTVTFTVPASGASSTLTSTTATTNASGVATVSATANTIAGTYNVAASSGALTPLALALTNTAGAIAAVTIGSGTPQSTTVGTAFASPLALTVTDAFGNPRSGIAVTLTAPGSGATASLSTMSTTTNALGQISIGATANNVAGTYVVTANVAGFASPTTFSLTNVAGAATSLAFDGGATQSTLVNTAFATALGVRITDAFGNAIVGRSVSFASPVSGASAGLSGTSVVTDATGRASVTATANTVAGAYSVSASSAGLTSLGFALTNTPGAPALVTVDDGTPQSTTVGTGFSAPLALTVTDAFGNPLSGIAVTLTVPGSGASATLATTSTTTDAFGRISIGATANGVAGSYLVTANIAGIGSPTTFALTNLAGAPAVFAFTGGATQSTLVDTAFGDALGVRITDALGNPIVGAPVTFSSPANGASAGLSSTTALTNAAGEASVTATANTIAGAYGVTASSGSLASLGFALTNTPGDAANVIVDGGASQSTTVDTAFGDALALTVTDRFGNPLSGVSVTLDGPLAGAAAILGATSTTTDAAGKVSVSASANTIAGAYVVTATIAGIAQPTTFSLTNLAAAPSVFTIEDGDAQTTTVDTAFAAALSTRLTDAFGNPIVGATVTFGVPATGATAVLAAMTAVTDANGIATVNATAGTVSGAYSVTADTSGLTTLSFALTNDVDAPAMITVNSGASQMGIVTEAFSDALVLTVADQFGNPLPGVTVTFTVPSTGPTATLSTMTAVTDASGQVSITATAGAIAGAYTVTASVTGVTEPGSFALVNLVSAPSEISVVGGAEQSTVVDTAFAEPLSVLVMDAQGNPVPGVTVTFTIPTSGATTILDALTATTDASGIATVNATANTVAGEYEVTASTPVSTTPATFALTNEAGAAASITGLITSSPQSATVATDFTNPLVVTVLDAFGNPVPNAVVVFTVPGSGPTAELEMTTFTTDANGNVSIIAGASPIAGSYVVTATTAGVTTPATFALTNLVGAPTTISVVSGGTQTTLATTAFGEPIVVEVLDAQGNPVPGVTISLILPTDGASATSSAVSIVTDEDGIAVITLTANALSGSYVVGIVVDGAATPTTANLANDVVETTTVLVVDEAYRLLGGQFVFTATVTGTVGTPTGSVRFMRGDEELAVVVLDENGVATFTFDALVIGESELTAIYVPDLPYVASTSAPVLATVLPGGLTGGAVCTATPNATGRGFDVASMTLLAIALVLVRRRAVRS